MEIPEIAAFFTENFLEAEEYVWLSNDMETVEAVLIQKPSLYKADKIVYLVQRTKELEELFEKLPREEFKKRDLRSLREYCHRNAGLPKISLIATLKR